MARKGDIDSKSVASRVPMEVYLRLLKNSSSNGKTLSSYLCDVLSDEKFGQGGQTKIEYQTKTEYQDRFFLDPKLVGRNKYLENQIKEQVVLIEELKSEIKETHKGWRELIKDEHKEIKKLKEEIDKLKGK